MKKLFFSAALIIISAVAGFAQTTDDEKAILKFIADYDQSYVNQDIAFTEANLPDDYTIANPYGEFKNKAQAIEEFRKDKTNPTVKTLSFKSTNENLRINGNTAIASGTWAWSGVPVSDLQAAPHTDTGRYQLVFEKRGGRWVLVSEMFSEAPHDKKTMEAQVLKMGQLYGEMIKRGSADEIGKILADEYFFTDENGKFLSRAEDLATYKNRKSKIETVETTDQKVRIVGSSTAVETGIFRVKGTNETGKPFDETYRYTTVWAWRDLRWQIVSDHTSTVKK
jgi:ketosteroid isomerase-like protein